MGGGGESIRKRRKKKIKEELNYKKGENVEKKGPKAVEEMGRVVGEK